MSFPVTDSVAESVTLTATDTTDSTPIAQTATVVFSGGGSPSAANSTVATAATTSPADGETQTLITVVLKDQLGAVVPGAKITLQGAPSVNVESHPISVGGTSTPGVTDTSGVVEFEALDSHAETVTFTATDTTAGPNVVLAQTVSITFVAGSVDTASQGTTVTVAPANPPADGSTPSSRHCHPDRSFLQPGLGQDHRAHRLEREVGHHPRQRRHQSGGTGHVQRDRRHRRGRHVSGG